jgi:hypothetical protein
MGLFDFMKQKLTEPKKQPEDFYDIKITDEFVSVSHPKFGEEQIKWKDIETIKIITTDEGPFLPDFWIGLFGQNKKCLLPQGARGYDEVYDIISKYDRFNFENVIAATGSTDNNEFLIWIRSQN